MAVTVESPLRREAHGGFGERPGETGRRQRRHRAPGRLSLGAWCDNTAESLVFRLRPGNAGANTAADNIAVCDEAIAQIPDPQRRDLLVTLDGAGATLDLIRHITKLNGVRGRRVHYSAGFGLDQRVRTAISHVDNEDWQHVWDRDGRPRPLHGHGAAGVAELTGLLRDPRKHEIRSSHRDH